MTQCAIDFCEVERGTLHSNIEVRTFSGETRTLRYVPLCETHRHEFVNWGERDPLDATASSE